MKNLDEGRSRKKVLKLFFFFSFLSDVMQETAECQCKANVQPGNCDTCIDGSFDLQESNPDGCTDCFCSGKSTYCQSHDRLVRSKVRNPFHFAEQIFSEPIL